MRLKLFVMKKILGRKTFTSLMQSYNWKRKSNDRQDKYSIVYWIEYCIVKSTVRYRRNIKLNELKRA